MDAIAEAYIACCREAIAQFQEQIHHSSKVHNADYCDLDNRKSDNLEFVFNVGLHSSPSPGPWGNFQGSLDFRVENLDPILGYTFAVFFSECIVCPGGSEDPSIMNFRTWN